jgi:hypothetical protein
MKTEAGVHYEVTIHQSETSAAVEFLLRDLSEKLKNKLKSETTKYSRPKTFSGHQRTDFIEDAGQKMLLMQMPFTSSILLQVT